MSSLVTWIHATSIAGLAAPIICILPGAFPPDYARPDFIDFAGPSTSTEPVGHPAERRHG
ncbi:hypothetical protein PQQ87_12355 [Paraburkholderia nemoris]|uniref:hypothetical protein n=1 Tax=Paraburkholderia nemoris TaxID=2793076 RepID=UPI0038B8C61B